MRQDLSREPTSPCTGAYRTALINARVVGTARCAVHSAHAIIISKEERADGKQNRLIGPSSSEWLARGADAAARRPYHQNLAPALSPLSIRHGRNARTFHARTLP